MAPLSSRKSPAHARPSPGAERAARVSERLKVLGLKRSAVRDAVLEAFFSAPGHVSLEELTARAKQRAPTAGYSTVYRTMRLLVEQGLASERDFGAGRTLYEPADGEHHHDHLVCTRCGAVQEFEDAQIEGLLSAVAQAHHFQTTAHRLEIYGLCARCARGRTA